MTAIDLFRPVVQVHAKVRYRPDSDAHFLRQKYLLNRLTLLVVVLVAASWFVLMSQSTRHTMDELSVLDSRASEQGLGPNWSGSTVRFGGTEGGHEERLSYVAPSPARPKTEENSKSRTRPAPDDYLKEFRDDPWASQKETAIYDVIPTVFGEATSILVDCRARLCRVEVVAPPTGPTCFSGEENDFELSEQEVRLMNQHVFAMGQVERAAEPDNYLFACDNVPGIYMTLEFDRVASE